MSYGLTRWTSSTSTTSSSTATRADGPFWGRSPAAVFRLIRLTPFGNHKHYDLYKDADGDEIEVHYFSSHGWLRQRCEGETPKLGCTMLTTQLAELLRRAGPLSSTRRTPRISSMSGPTISSASWRACPIRFQGAPTGRRKWKSGLALLAELASSVFSVVRYFPAFILIPTLRRCVMLSREVDAVTGLVPTILVSQSVSRSTVSRHHRAWL